MFLFAPIRWALRIPSMIISAAVVYVVVSGVQVIVASRQSATAATLAPAAAVVVLPAPLGAAGAPSGDLLGRLQEALTLYQGHVANRILLGGGPSTAPASSGASSGPSSASVGRSWLVARGVPAAAVLALSAPSATDTLAAAKADLPLGSTVAVVTDAMDALWTRGAASADGLLAEVAPAVGSTAVTASDLGPLWRQATGVAAGRVIGYSHTTWAGG